MTFVPYSRERLEREKRVSELNPPKTLSMIGLNKGEVFCDIGAGTGIFTVEAARMTEALTYALEINEEMIDIIEDKAKSLGLTNIKTAQVSTDLFPVPSQSCDIVLLSTVFREIDDRDILLKEMRRILKCATSRLVIIELHKRLTEIGPPVDARMSEEEVKERVEEEGFVLKRSEILGDNYYCLIFERS